MLELTFHSSFDAEDSVDSLKTVREEIQVFSSSNHSDLREFCSVAEKFHRLD